MTETTTTTKPPLVSTKWARENLENDDVRFIEVDVDTSVYETGHLPGAVGWNWTEQLQDPVRRDVASKTQVETLLREAGVSDDTTVVLYGDNDNWFASYAFWLLKYRGFPTDRLRLLDGGRTALEREDQPLTKETKSFSNGDVTLGEERDEIRAYRDDVLPSEGGQDQPLVDVRSADEFTGKILAPPGLDETAQRGGHIPGAVNIPWSQAVDEETGRFKGPDELEALYGAAGAGPDTETIAYCRIGERSSHTWFALHEILGWPTRNYDGSWTEYGNLVNAPIER